LSLTIGFVDMPTGRTLAAGVARINRDDWHAKQFGLVGDKCPELGERPRVQNRSLAASGGCPLADMRQILKRNAAVGVVCSLYDLLRDDVIYVFGKELLFAGKSFQFALGRRGLLGCNMASFRQASFATPLACQPFASATNAAN